MENNKHNVLDSNRHRRGWRWGGGEKDDDYNDTCKACIPWQMLKGTSVIGENTVTRILLNWIVFSVTGSVRSAGKDWAGRGLTDCYGWEARPQEQRPRSGHNPVQCGQPASALGPRAQQGTRQEGQWGQQTVVQTQWGQFNERAFEETEIVCEMQNCVALGRKTTFVWCHVRNIAKKINK